MKYRKKPLEVEAMQFKRYNFGDIVKFTNGKAINFQIERIYANGECWCEIQTLEGVMKVNENDYIIKGVNGEFYPCKPDIFNKAFEKV